MCVCVRKKNVCVCVLGFVAMFYRDIVNVGVKIVICAFVNEG